MPERPLAPETAHCRRRQHQRGGVQGSELVCEGGAAAFPGDLGARLRASLLTTLRGERAREWGQKTWAASKTDLMRSPPFSWIRSRNCVSFKIAPVLYPTISKSSGKLNLCPSLIPSSLPQTLSRPPSTRTWDYSESLFLSSTSTQLPR